MPLYEFSCESCQEISEHLMKISDPAPESCPVCNKKGTLKKLLSRSNFVLKGTGWYETDFKGKEKSNKGGGATQTSSKKTGSNEKNSTSTKKELSSTSSVAGSS